jgi:hypothetical protein
MLLGAKMWHIYMQKVITGLRFFERVAIPTSQLCHR